VGLLGGAIGGLISFVGCKTMTASQDGASDSPSDLTLRPHAAMPPYRPHLTIWTMPVPVYDGLGWAEPRRPCAYPPDDWQSLL